MCQQAGGMMHDALLIAGLMRSPPLLCRFSPGAARCLPPQHAAVHAHGHINTAISTHGLLRALSPLPYPALRLGVRLPPWPGTAHVSPMRDEGVDRWEAAGAET